MSSTRPTAKEQLQLFKKFNDDGLFAVDSCKVGDFWWVVSLAWFNQWKAHVDWHGDGEAAGERRAPGPIDNSDIQAKGFAKNTTRLRPGLALEADYTILPDAVWTKFVEWYTIVEAQSPGVRRSVAGAKEKIVEVSAPVFDLLFASEAWLGGDPDEAIEIVVSKYQKLDSLIDAIIAQLAIDRDLSPSDVPDTQNIRLWFSLGKGKKYHLVPQDDDFMNSVMLLTPPGSDVGVCRVPAPRLLVDLRENAEADWLRQGMEDDDDLPARERKQVEAEEAAKAAEERAAEEAKKSSEKREREAAMDDATWRRSLDVGWLADVYDGSEWRESTVLEVSADDAEVLVVGFRAEPGHTLTTQRNAGAGAEANGKAVAGDLAKPYSKVGDWRTQLRQDMRIEVLGTKRRFYHDPANSKYLHYHEGDKEWWLSDKGHFDSAKAFGYLYCAGTPERPPPTPGPKWRIHRYGRWITSPDLHISFAPNTFDEGSEGKDEDESDSDRGNAAKDLYIANGGLLEDDMVVISAEPNFEDEAQDVVGKYRPMEQFRWRKERVVKVDYKRRLVTITDAPTSVYHASVSYMTRGYWEPGRKTISLDSDTIRKLTIRKSGRGSGDNASDDVELGKALATTTVCGLRNLGNTCFMNSVLQCLFAVPQLAELFVSKDEIGAMLNPGNPLGTGGELAKAFSGLIQNVAFSRGKTQVPNVFKQVLGNFSPRFAGFEQQDAMELFNTAVDLLHEDLNRILKKPYVESVESGSDPDDVVAKESWRRHKLRNDSVIVDLFQGQFKSHLTCPNESCKGKSWRKFDPFTAVSCPLPPAKKKKASYDVTVYTQKGIADLADFEAPPDSDPKPDVDSQEEEPQERTVSTKTPPGIFVVELQAEQQGSVVAEQISQYTGIPTARLLVAQMRQGYFDSVLFDSTMGTDESFFALSGIAVFEIPEEFDSEKHIMVVVRFERRTAGLLMIPKTWTNRQLHLHVEHLMRRRLRQSEDEVLKAPLPRIQKGDMVKFPHPERDEETTGRVLSCWQGLVVRLAEDLADGHYAPTYRVKLSDTSHQVDFQKSALQFLRKEGVWGPQLPKESDSSDDEDEANDATDAPLGTDVQRDGEEQVRAREPELLPNRAYAVRYFCRREDYYGMTSGIVSERLAQNYSRQNIFWILKVDDKPVRENIAMLDLVIDRELRLVVDPAFDAAVEHPVRWVPPKDEPADGDAEDDGSLTLRKCLTKFATREQLGEMDTWYCPGCKEHVQAFKKMDIWKLPPVLVFHLKRFSYEMGDWSTRREKLEEFVDFPFEIDMAPFVVGNGEGESGTKEDTESRGNLVYELIAVSNHMGNLGFGHYTAYSKRGDQWFECDDSVITKVTAEQVKTSDAYVLFYQRKVDAEKARARIKERTATGQASEGGSSPKAGPLPSEAETVPLFVLNLPVPYEFGEDSDSSLSSDEDDDDDVPLV